MFNQAWWWRRRIIDIWLHFVVVKIARTAVSMIWRYPICAVKIAVCHGVLISHLVLVIPRQMVLIRVGNVVGIRTGKWVLIRAGLAVLTGWFERFLIIYWRRADPFTEIDVATITVEDVGVRYLMVIICQITNDRDKCCDFF